MNLYFRNTGNYQVSLDEPLHSIIQWQDCMESPNLAWPKFYAAATKKLYSVTWLLKTSISNAFFIILSTYVITFKELSVYTYALWIFFFAQVSSIWYLLCRHPKIPLYIKAPKGLVSYLILFSCIWPAKIQHFALLWIQLHLNKFLTDLYPTCHLTTFHIIHSFNFHANRRHTNQTPTFSPGSIIS